jgi:hypothetical protein
MAKGLLGCIFTLVILQAAVSSITQRMYGLPLADGGMKHQKTGSEIRCWHLVASYLVQRLCSESRRVMRCVVFVSIRCLFSCEEVLIQLKTFVLCAFVVGTHTYHVHTLLLANLD